MKVTNNIKRQIGAIGTMLVAVTLGVLVTGSALAEKNDPAVEAQFQSFLARAVITWSGESMSADVPSNLRHKGVFFAPQNTSGIKSMSKKTKGSDDHSSDDHSSDDHSSDAKSADDESSDGGSDDHSSADKQSKCMPNLTVEFNVDNLSVSIASDKKLKSVILLFHDGSTQQVAKLKGKTGLFAGTGDKAGEVLTGAWVKSGCNDDEVSPAMPCPIEDDDSSSDDESNSDDDSSSEDGSSKDRAKNHRMRLAEMLASGECDDGDISCPVEDDDSSSDDESNSDDDSSSDDGSSDDDGSEDGARKCGEFFPNDMTPTEAPAVSIAGAQAVEGSNLINRKTKEFSPEKLVFVVTLSSPVPDGQVAEVEFTTANGTAIACENFSYAVPKCLDTSGEDADFIGLNGILMFEAGSISQRVTIETIPDDKSESDESFEVILLNPSNNLRLGEARAIGIIENDDDEDE